MQYKYLTTRIFCYRYCPYTKQMHFNLHTIKIRHVIVVLEILFYCCMTFHQRNCPDRGTMRSHAFIEPKKAITKSSPKCFIWLLVIKPPPSINSERLNAHSGNDARRTKRKHKHCSGGPRKRTYLSDDDSPCAHSPGDKHARTENHQN